MKIKIYKKENTNIINDYIVNIEYKSNLYIDKFEKYIKRFERINQDIIVEMNKKFLSINKNDIIKIYSEKKYNFCKTENGIFKTRNNLYEIEKKEDFLRISRNCVINVNMVVNFDFSISGKVVVNLKDKTQEFVSRRRLRNVLDYFEERRFF